MEFVKANEYGICKICGGEGHIRFGICGGNCIEDWENKGKWEWDKDNQNLAKLSYNEKIWYYEETRPKYMKNH
jgi:hypothetical protein